MSGNGLQELNAMGVRVVLDFTRGRIGTRRCKSSQTGRDIPNSFSHIPRFASSFVSRECQLRRECQAELFVFPVIFRLFSRRPVDSGRGQHHSQHCNSLYFIRTSTLVTPTCNRCRLLTRSTSHTHPDSFPSHQACTPHVGPRFTGRVDFWHFSERS
jgi:hypothetical protein